MSKGKGSGNNFCFSHLGGWKDDGFIETGNSGQKLRSIGGVGIITNVFLHCIYFQVPEINLIDEGHQTVDYKILILRRDTEHVLNIHLVLAMST